MSRERNPLCSRCGVRPRIPKQAYCRECRAVRALECTTGSIRKRNGAIRQRPRRSESSGHKRRRVPPPAAAVSVNWKHGAARKMLKNWPGG